MKNAARAEDVKKYVEWCERCKPKYKLKCLYVKSQTEIDAIVSSDKEITQKAAVRI